MASSALRRAMIQVAGERDIGSQETAHMLLGKPLYSCTYSFLCVSLDGSRRVRTGDDDDENQGDQALDPSVLDHYATRARGISVMLLGDFAQLLPFGDKPIYASLPGLCSSRAR